MKVRLTYLTIAAISLMGIYSVEAQGLQIDFNQKADTWTTTFTITDVMIPLGDGTRLHGCTFIQGREFYRAVKQRGFET